MKSFLYLIFVSTISVYSQNNYIVKTDDGRRVLLKADFTWEFIDLQSTAEKNTDSILEEKVIEKKDVSAVSNNGCNLSLHFTEPSLNLKTQALLKRSRSDIFNLKKKVAKKENCEVDAIKLLTAKETKAKGTYTFCTCNGKVAYKRNGSAFFRKGKLL